MRHELAEGLTSRTVRRGVPLLARDDVPEHVRALTSRDVLDVEADLTTRFSTRAERPVIQVQVAGLLPGHELNQAQGLVVGVSATAGLMVIEGAAGAGKTTTLAAAADLLAIQHQRLVVVTPTLKGCPGRRGPNQCRRVLRCLAGPPARLPLGRRRPMVPRPSAGAQARLRPGDLLLVDEAGMLDQDTALALLAIADEASARVAFVGDRHQLLTVGRGGVLDHAARWARPEACLTL